MVKRVLLGFAALSIADGLGLGAYRRPRTSTADEG